MVCSVCPSTRTFSVTNRGGKLLAFGDQGGVLSQHDFSFLDDFAQIAVDAVLGTGLATPGKAGQQDDPPAQDRTKYDSPEHHSPVHYWKNSSSAMSR